MGVPAAVCCRTAATRDGPRRLTSTAASRGASKLTVAAEWTTVEQEDSSSRPSSSRPSPSKVTSPARGMTRRAASASNRSPSSLRRRSKQLFRRRSRSARSLAPLRPGRTMTTTSVSGRHRSTRSVSAVPRNPVAPVIAIRRPASASRSIPRVYHARVGSPQVARLAQDPPTRCPAAPDRTSRTGVGPPWAWIEGGCTGRCFPAAGGPMS